MRNARAYLLIFLLLIQAPLEAQQSMPCDDWKLEAGTDLLPFDSISFSIRMINSDIMEDAQIGFCPAGIEHSSPNDVKKRKPFRWTVKYNNIYLETAGGIIVEGMNEHGFSASLMFLEDSRVAEKEKRLIPLAASLSVNFFIDHFKCIDTALLAVWDIRIFDDVGLDCGWPFRLILHDSTGATAYIEYVEKKLRVYTPGPPALLVSGPEYARLITIKHLSDSIPQTQDEKRYLDILKTNDKSDISTKLLQHYDENYIDFPYGILRDHMNKGIIIMNPSSEQRVYDFSEIGFIQGEVYYEKIF